MKAAIGFTLGLALLVIACAGSTGDAPEGKTAPRGEQLYAMHCILCHGKDGKLGFNGAKDLTASTLTREQMRQQVAEGKGKMMPYKNVLTPKEIEAVVDYTRGLGKAR
ncbi:MAG: cytochrome c [Flavobacteriales bacterium]|nr:cytochrome c [Flavobacteriales bacterium]